MAYGVRANGQRQLLGFTRARGESQAAWEGFLRDLQQRGLCGSRLQLVLTDGCARTGRGHRNHLSPRAPPALLGAQEKGPARRPAPARSGLRQARRPAHLLARNTAQAPPGLRAFPFPLAEHLPGPGQAVGARPARTKHVFRLPAALMAQAAHHHAIERCFVEVRRRTRPMVLFTTTCRGWSESSMPFFTDSISNGKTAPFSLFTQAA